ncbi:BTB/POZ protein [Fennellomyces sp. T-0311]|nr:BTB/POZ protein [Fennellomyces sp. T-0311]
MGKKKATVATKSRIMKLASESGEHAIDESTQEWLENEPKLNANSVNLFEDLCDATKQGDLEKTESLVRNFGAPINMVDAWQCNPLYYACLCGHYEVVKFLLESGAQCDPNTFTGERCLYGALNDKIRRLLRSYKFSTAINENQPYLQFLTNLYENNPYDDLTFMIRRSAENDEDGGVEEFTVQRFVMATRSTYFREQLLGRWHDEKQVKLSSKLVDPTAFRAVLKYLYTGQLLDITNEALRNMIFVCKHLEMPDLQEQCEAMLEADSSGEEQKNANRAQDAKAMARIRGDYEVFLQTILGCAYLVTKNNDGAYITGEPWLEDESKIVPPEAAFADVGIVVEDALFLCHRATLCRSEYFNIMFHGAFSEADTDLSTIYYGQKTVQLPLIEVHDILPESFQYILEYLYTDRCTIPLELAYEVLLASDMMMLERLKSITAITLTSTEEPIMDIYELIRTAIRMNVDRLEQWCIKYMADHLDDFISRPEFQDLIRESAHSIAGRQETDSIPLIDDLRYFLGKKYFIFEEELNPEGKVNEEYDLTDMEALYNEKLDMLDRVLESLGLEA